MSKAKDWISAGGMLGLAILTARLTRTPLAAILVAVPQLLRLMQSYERIHAQSRPQGTAAAQMTREEAALILGVPVDAAEEAVRAAHRNLIRKNHPDAGGSDYLAAKINQARDVLLGS